MNTEKPPRVVSRMHPHCRPKLSITPTDFGWRIETELINQKECDELAAHIKIIRRSLRHGRKWFNFGG